jgi:hypothetical protein
VERQRAADIAGRGLAIAVEEAEDGKTPGLLGYGKEIAQGMVGDHPVTLGHGRPKRASAMP